MKTDKLKNFIKKRPKKVYNSIINYSKKNPDLLFQLGIEYSDIDKVKKSTELPTCRVRGLYRINYYDDKTEIIISPLRDDIKFAIEKFKFKFEKFEEETNPKLLHSNYSLLLPKKMKVLEIKREMRKSGYIHQKYGDVIQGIYKYIYDKGNDKCDVKCVRYENTNTIFFDSDFRKNITSCYEFAEPMGYEFGFRFKGKPGSLKKIMKEKRYVLNDFL